jgi:FkbH-like protein
MLDNSLYTNYGVLFSLEATKIISKNISNIFRSISSKIIKCIIVDLDNTIWGGVIGDDGLSKIQIGNYGIGKSFTLFQKWLKSTKELGIILCVCSKNDERNAKLPFVKHPEMILQLDDITLFVANWEDKDKNIKMIKETLNIDFESIVFIDDNKFERNIVKKSFPEILVPDLPEDPVNYLEFIIQENFLENNINSKNKNILNRTELYKTEFKRIKKKQQFKNNDAFLKGLKMKSSIEVLTKFNIPRISELTKRTNQFNLTNKRFEEFELLNISTLENNFSFSFSLNDKFGDYGIVSFIILEKKSPESLQIINWNMSCRVFKRGLEGFIINQLNIYFSKLNFKYIHGKLIPTKKNNILKDFLKIAGIILDDSNQFCIELKKIKINKTFIENE